MANIKAIYECSNCGSQFPKWVGRCDSCGKWGTVSESTVEPRKNLTAKDLNKLAAEPVDFSSIKNENFERLKTGIEEFDRVLGGGATVGSLVLIGGDPGIGKSTLALQIAQKVASIGKSAIYISGEESAGQIKSRVERLGLNSSGLSFLAQNNLEIICATAEKYRPDFMIVDSIQTVIDYSIGEQPGSINQVRLCVSRLMELAKKNNTAIFLIGHVTKEGVVAGPKTVEHLVDTVLYLEGDKFHQYRILRSVKNRFGPTSEVGIFEMREQGLIEVKNPSQIFIEQRREDTPGSVITCIMEGKRPILVEVQALVSKTVYGYPQRKAVGFDINRLQLLATVLSKRTNVNVLNYDIFFNIAGGLKTGEPAIDLAVICSIYSAYANKIIDPGTVVFGEVGLGGEVRPVSNIEMRVKESLKLGFKKAIIPFISSSLGNLESNVIKVKNIQAAMAVLEK